MCSDFFAIILWRKSVRTFISEALVGSCLRTMTTLTAEQELLDSAVTPGTKGSYPNGRF